MRAAVDSLHLSPEQDAELWEYLEHAAQFMVNTFED
jgi:hemoglobin